MEAGSPIAVDFSYPYDDTIFDANLDHKPSISTQSGASTKAKSRHNQNHASIASLDSITGIPQSLENQTSTVDGDNPRPGDDLENTPAWTELKTKAGKERKRLPLACIACRRKKVKCSGDSPSCSHCKKARVPCVYKVTTRKAAPRTDYMAMLDKRLKRMEDRVIKIIPKEDLGDTSQRSSVRPPVPGTGGKIEKADGKRSVEEAFTSELTAWSKPRTNTTQLDGAARVRSQKDAENRLAIEGAEALPPQHIQEHLAEVFFDCLYGQSYLLLHKPSFMRKLKAGTVPPVLILAVCAISARFSTHPQVSSEPAFLRGEQWATPAKTIVEKRHFEPTITVLTCMIILGLHYFGTCEGGLSWSFGGQAMRMGYALQLHKELDHDPLGLAQAERAAASGKPVPRTNELSFTDREIRRRTMWACFLMDTFNSSGTERPSFLNEEYMFIQLPIKESNFQMEIPGHTEDLEGHVPLNTTRSSLEDYEASAKANMGVEAYVIRAVVVWKRIVQYLNLGGKEKDAYPIWDSMSKFAKLQRQITQLKTSLPTSLENNKENLQQHVTERLANQFIFLHIVMAQNNLFLHRFAIPTAPNTHRPYAANTPKPFLAQAATVVLDAASAISQLLSDSTGHTLTVPFAGYCAYTSATVHVWGIFSKNKMLENTSRDNLRHNYKYLNRMKRYWGMFHYMAESIKDTYRSFAEASIRNERKQQARLQRTESGRIENLESGAVSAEQQSRAASPGENDLDERSAKLKADGSKVKVFQYGDWFNKYPHGVSEQEWEQSRLPHKSETQKGNEAVMSQQAELQSVEEFFASLAPPSKSEDGPNKKRVARKRGKSMAEEKQRRDSGNSEPIRKQSSAGRKQSSTTIDKSYPGLSSSSLHPLSDQTFPQLDLSTAEIDVPMSGISTGLQSGSGNSAFDLTSPIAPYSATSMDGNFSFNNVTGPTSNPRIQPTGQSPFEYTSPASSSNAGSNPPGLNFNFNYTSAVPQLDRQMVYSSYAGMDANTTGQTDVLNSLDFWASPWDGAVDTDGMSGFNDPSFGLNQGSGMSVDRPDQRSQPVQQYTSNNSQNQNMSSTAWFMPFNIKPPNSSFASGNTPGGLDDFPGFDALMDMGGFPFSPNMGEQDGNAGI